MMKKKWKAYLALLAAAVITVSTLPVPSLAAPQAGTESQTDKQDTVSDETTDNTQNKNDENPSDETPAPGTETTPAPGADDKVSKEDAPADDSSKADTAPAAQEGPALFSMPVPVNANAVEIKDQNDYLQMISDVNSGTATKATEYVQTADITLYDPTVRTGTKDHPFLSSYDGGGFKITVVGDTDNYSIFGVVGTSDAAPSISNITTNRRLADTITNGSITGCKVRSDATVSAPTPMSNDIPSSPQCIGGFANIMSGGTISGCYVNTKINADASSAFIGGFIGNLAGGTITKSFADTDITSAASGSDSFMAGGFAGNMGVGTTIESSFSSGTMRVKGGGFTGHRRENSKINQCYTVMRLLVDNSEPLALQTDGSVTTTKFKWSYQACGIEKREDDMSCKTTSAMATDGLFTDTTGISSIDTSDPYCIGARIAVEFPGNERSGLFHTAFTIPSQNVVGGDTKLEFESSRPFPQGIESSTDNTVTYDFRKGGSDLSGTIKLSFNVNTGNDFMSKSIEIKLSDPIYVNKLSDFEKGSSHSRYILKSDISADNGQLFNNFSGLIDGNSHTIREVGNIDSKPLVGTLENGGLIRNLMIEEPSAALVDVSDMGTMENIIINSPNILAPGSSDSEDDLARAVGAAANTSEDGAVFSNIRVRNGEITTGETQGNIASGYAGGIVGVLGLRGDPCHVSYCISALDSITGRITGGIAGSVGYGSIASSFSLGDIKGDRYSGGIAGDYDTEGGGSIDKAYSSASVTAEHHAGGISPGEIIVSNSYFSGTLGTADEEKGRLYAISDAFSPDITECYYDNLMAPQDVKDINKGMKTSQMVESVSPAGFTKDKDQYPSLDTSDSACKWDATDALWQKAATLPIWIRAAEHGFADHAMDIKYPVKISTDKGFDYKCPSGEVRTGDSLILAPEEKGYFNITASLTGSGTTVKKNFRLHTDGFTYLDSDAFKKLKNLDKYTNYCLLPSNSGTGPDEIFRPHQDYTPGEYKGTFLGDGAVIGGLRTPFVAFLKEGRILGTVFFDSSISGSGSTGVIAETMSDGSTIFACAAEGDILLKRDAEAVGGLVGSMTGGSTITDSYSLTRIRAEGGSKIQYAGGITGTADSDSTITQAYFSGNISAGQNVGGIAGKVNNSDINKVYTYGQLTASSGGYASGIVAVSENSSSILNAFYAPEITCTSVDGAHGTWRTTEQLIKQDLEGFVKHNTGSSVRLPSLKNLEAEHSGLTGTVIDTGSEQYGGLGITSTIPVQLAQDETLLNVESEFTLGDERQWEKWTAQTVTQNPSASLFITAKDMNTVATPSCKNELPVTNSFKLIYTGFGRRVLYVDLVNDKAKDVYRAVYDHEDDKNYYFKIKRFVGWEGEALSAAITGTTGRTQTVSYRTFRGTVPEDKIFKNTSGNKTFAKDTTELTVTVPKASDSGVYYNKPLQFYLEITGTSGESAIIDAGKGDNCCKVKSQYTMINSDYIYQNAYSSFNNAFVNEAFESKEGSELLKSSTDRTYSVDPMKGSGKYGEYFSSIGGNIYVQVETGFKKKGSATSTRNVSMDVSANSTSLFYGYEDIYNVNNYDVLPYRHSDWNNVSFNWSAIRGDGEKQAFVIPADVNDHNIKVAVSNDAPSFNLYINKVGTRALFGKEEAPWLKNPVISRNTFGNGDMMYVALQMNEIIENFNTIDSYVTLEYGGQTPVSLDYVAGEGTTRLLFSGKCNAPATSSSGAVMHYYIKDAKGVADNKAGLLEGTYSFNVNIQGAAEPASVLMRMQRNDSSAPPAPVLLSAPSTYANRVELTAADFASAEMFELIKRNLEMNLNVTDFDGEHVYQDQCDKITYLSMDGAGLTSMKGVDKLPNLTFLSLKDNQISSLEEIQSLMHLEELNLSKNQITSLAGLGNNPVLKKLLVNGNLLTSTEGLGGCPALTTFQAVGNRITTLTGLPASLDTLMLTDNQIASIHGLEQLTGLKKMSLGDNPIRKVEGLDTLTGLNYLGLVGCEIEQLDGISNLTGLDILFLTRNSLKTLKNFDTLPTGIKLATVSLNDIDIKGEYKEYEALKDAYGNHLLIGLQGAVNGAVYEQPKVLFYEDAVESEEFESTALLDGKKLPAGFTTAGPGKHVVSRMDGAAGDKLSETFHAEFTVKGSAVNPGTSGQTGTAKTGDTSLTGLYLLLMFASALAAAFEIVRRKRRHQK